MSFPWIVGGTCSYLVSTSALRDFLQLFFYYSKEKEGSCLNYYYEEIVECAVDSSSISTLPVAMTFALTISRNLTSYLIIQLFAFGHKSYRGPFFLYLNAVHDSVQFHTFCLAEAMELPFIRPCFSTRGPPEFLLFPTHVSLSASKRYWQLPRGTVSWPECQFLTDFWLQMQ